MRGTNVLSTSLNSSANNLRFFELTIKLKVQTWLQNWKRLFKALKFIVTELHLFIMFVAVTLTAKILSELGVNNVSAISKVQPHFSTPDLGFTYSYFSSIYSVST